jgi:hypothetical protein
MGSGLLFYALSSYAEGTVAAAIAFGTAVFEAARACAVMTQEEGAHGALHVEAHRDLARGAKRKVATIPAEYEASRTTAVHKEDGLLALAKSSVQGTA